MSGSPSPNGRNGSERDPSTGRFVKGNAGGPGNPHAGRVGQLRTAMLDTVTAEDVRAITRKLVELARGGDVRAMKEIFDRSLGRPIEMDIVDRLDALERVLKEANK